MNYVEEALRVEKEILEKVRTKQDGVYTFYDNAILRIISLFKHTFGTHSEWDSGPIQDPRYSDHLSMLKNYIDKSPRFVDIASRSAKFPNSSMHVVTSESMLVLSQGMYEPMTWKGKQLYKTAQDLCILQTLLWDLAPKTIVEMGSGNGSSAEFMHDMMTCYGYEHKIISFDIKNENTVYRKDDIINYLWADFNQISTLMKYSDILQDAELPILFVEDAHVNVEEVLMFLSQYASEGDYFYVEDMHTEKYAAFYSWMTSSNKFMIDTKYTDMFGINNSSSAEGIVKVIS